MSEPATFCKTGDDKRPGLVPASITAGVSDPQICPDDLTKGASEVEDAVPLAWYVRVVFDELLNPEIEELVPIADSDLFEGSLAKSQPVILSCGGVTVPYDGYYNPSGNNITWPLAPSLFIQPLASAFATIPTGSACTVMIKADVVVDKDGERVPTAQIGPYAFKLADLSLDGTDPAPPRDATKPGTIAPEDPVVLTFNAHVDFTTLDAALVTIREVATCADTDGTVRTATVAAAEDDPTSIAISDADAGTGLSFEPEKTYVITFAAGAEVKQDIPAGAGVVALPGAAKLTLCFKTDMPSPE